MTQVKEDTNTNIDKKKSVELTPAIEERLKVIASIIVERIVEDQKNGNLRFKHVNK